MLYVIHSKSEKGFWDNNIGWVFRVSDASLFTQKDKETLNLPNSVGKDAEWLIVDYDENSNRFTYERQDIFDDYSGPDNPNAR